MGFWTRVRLPSTPLLEMLENAMFSAFLFLCELNIVKVIKTIYNNIKKVGGILVTREQIIEKIQQFRLMDDDFMTKVFDNDIELTEFILRIILDNPDIKVKEVNTQWEIKK